MLDDGVDGPLKPLNTAGPSTAPPDPVRVAVEAFTSSLSELVRPDDLLTTAELMAQVSSLELLRCRLDAAVGYRLSVLDRSGGCDIELGMSTHGWLAWDQSMPKATAARRVRSGRILTSVRAVGEALAAGRICMEHAQVFAATVNVRNHAAMSAAAPALIDAAGAMAFEAWADEVRALARLADEDGPEPTEVRERLSVRHVGDATVVDGVYGQAHGHLLASAVDAVADELFRSHAQSRAEDPDHVVPSRGELRAAALLELVHRGQAVDATSSKAARPEAVFVVHPARPSTGGQAEVSDLSGRRIHDPRVWDILSDCTHTFAQVDSFGNVVAFGRPISAGGPGLADPDHRTSCPHRHIDRTGRGGDMGAECRCDEDRHASRAQRRALELRDGKCVFPGCDAAVNWCDAHHVLHHRHGGPTVVANLALLCRRHHGVAHRRDWQVHMDEHQRVTFITPDGQRLAARRGGRQPGAQAA